MRRPSDDLRPCADALGGTVTLTLTIPGAAVTGQRRAVSVAGRPALAWSPQYRAWMKHALAHAIEWRDAQCVAMPLRGAVELRVQVYLPRPQKRPTVLGRPHPRWHEGQALHLGRQDLDNLCKGPLDALTQAGIIEDDRMVVGLFATKRYHAVDEGPRTIVHVTTLET